jgi:hypothetical protein
METSPWKSKKVLALKESVGLLLLPIRPLSLLYPHPLTFLPFPLTLKAFISLVVFLIELSFPLDL